MKEKDILIIIIINEYEIRYICNTEHGSSELPIINYNKFIN